MPRAHPRVGGEDSAEMNARLLVWGSPPRRRGRRQRFVADVTNVGLTPA